MKPTVARTVHFQPYDHTDGEPAQPRAAIITAVHSENDVALTVLNPTGMSFKLDVPHSKQPKPGHWNWPPREEAPKASGGRIEDAGRASGGIAGAVGAAVTISGGVASGVHPDTAAILAHVGRNAVSQNFLR